MKDEILITSILSKYALSRPLPPSAQDHALKMQRISHRHILKKLGLYSAGSGLAIYACYLFKTIGLKLTMAQSAVLACITTGVMVAGISAGGYYIAAETIKTNKEHAVPFIITGTAGAYSEKTIGDDKKVTPRATDMHRIQFHGLEYSRAVAGPVHKAADAITIELQHAGIEMTRSADTDLVLTGSVEKTDDTYQLSLQLYDKNTREIIFTSAEEVKSLDFLPAAGKRIAGDLSRKIIH